MKGLITMKQYIIDAFAEMLFSGNQAAVCVLDEWIPDALMQSIARENNFSETAFTVKEDNAYHLRWFTPGGEIDLRGHATLACAYVIMRFYEADITSVIFKTLSGNLTVERKNDTYEMDFPVCEFAPTAVTDKMEKALGVRPEAAYLGRDLMLVLNSENDVISLNPDMTIVSQLDGLALAVTAKGSKYDCVSRVFAPKLNITEDPVTGSTHCMIAPYWSQRLEKKNITAYQPSERKGILYCTTEGNRIKLAGKAVLYSVSDICIDL